MASWQDGPEYAPTARPDEFAEPQVEPLEDPPPVLTLSGAPDERPRFDEPTAPVAPLATLVPEPADQRDPQQAFAVVSSTLTTGGPWGGIHGATPAVAADPWASGPAAPAHDAAFPSAAPFPRAYHATDPFLPTESPPAPAGFPEPGTPQWFGPGQYGEQPIRGRADARALWAAATPALLIVLVSAVLIKVLAPLLLVTAFVLARRVLVAQAQVQRSFVIALGTLGTFALIGLLTGPLGFGDWWGFLGTWGRLTSLATLVSTLLLVRRALLAGEAPTPPRQDPPADSYRGPWG